jgi:uncharacterized membrane protein YphA (DoxX/SURF4 family)
MLAVLRIMAALLFMEHGCMKLFHFPAAQPGAPDPLPMMLMIAALIEVVGGALLWGALIGLLDRFKTAIGSPVAAGIQVMFATQALGGIERDFSAAFANMIQALFLLLLVMFFLGRREPVPQSSTLEAVAPSIQ